MRHDGEDDLLTEQMEAEAVEAARAEYERQLDEEREKQEQAPDMRRRVLDHVLSWMERDVAWYDAEAEAFYARHHVHAPGKDVSAAEGTVESDELRARLWGEWLRERRAVVAHELRELIESENR